MTNISIDFVIKLALILILSILPSLVYLLIFQKAKKRWQTRLRRAQNIHYHNYRGRFRRNIVTYDDRHEATLLRERRRTVTKYFIGDTSCVNNARSPYIRCAINPEGPCEDCRHYEKHPNRQLDQN